MMLLEQANMPFINDDASRDKYETNCVEDIVLSSFT
jgi:hypothetical protein